jgi:hypothetical protein
VRHGCRLASQLPGAQQYLLWAIRSTVHADADRGVEVSCLVRTFAVLGLADALPPIRMMLLALHRSLRFPLVVLDPAHGCIACGERCLLDFFVESSRGDGPTRRAWASVLPLEAYAVCADAAQRAARAFAAAGMPLDASVATRAGVRMPPPHRLQ